MTADLRIRPADECRYDGLALGEVMLRLDPGEGRIRTARRFTAWEGGGEYNVIRGLRRVFGLRGAVVTALVDDEVGRLVEDFVLTGGLDVSHIRWVAETVDRQVGAVVGLRRRPRSPPPPRPGWPPPLAGTRRSGYRRRSGGPGRRRRARRRLRRPGSRDRSRRCNDTRPSGGKSA